MSISNIGHTKPAPQWQLKLLMSLLASTFFFFSSQAFSASDITYKSVGQWNGKKIYLSPARHSDTGRRGECTGPAGMGNLDENTAAFGFAYYSASGNYIGSNITSSRFRNLRARGYRVRIGRGTVRSAISNSNAWGATVHIPIHSNARSENCNDNRENRHGTHVIYKSFGKKGGEGLSELLKNTIGSASPGTNDLICHNSSPCTLFNCLGELCRTRAKAAYLEREFHSWNKGAKWMATDKYNTWRLGWAVDRFLGYPRG